jgi:hypothetical protein
MKQYDFTIDGERVGSFELSEKPGWIHTNARFTIDGVLSENPFAVRLDGGLPVAVKAPGKDWQPVEPGVYPTSAWPLVLRAGLREYRALDEGSGKVVLRTLREEEGLVVEYQGTRVTRRFRVENEVVSYIHWGDSAESRILAGE